MEPFFAPRVIGETEQFPLFEVQNAHEISSVEETAESEYKESLRRCIYCGTILDPSDNNTYSEVLTWLRGRNKDSSTLRTYTGRLSCSSHIHNLRSGISPTQAGIVELADEAPVAIPRVEEAFTDQSEDYQIGWRYGYSNDALPSDFQVSIDMMTGYTDGQDKRELDRWK
jgi:hypothetical protein